MERAAVGRQEEGGNEEGESTSGAREEEYYETKVTEEAPVNE